MDNVIYKKLQMIYGFRYVENELLYIWYIIYIYKKNMTMQCFINIHF